MMAGAKIIRQLLRGNLPNQSTVSKINNRRQPIVIPLPTSTRKSTMKKQPLHFRSLHSSTLLRSSASTASSLNHSLITRSIPSCKSLDSLLRVHARLVVMGIAGDKFTTTHLLKAYSSFQKWNSARLVFNSVPEPDVVLYNLMIRTYTRSNQSSIALELYREMLIKGIKPDKYSYTFVVKACAQTLDFEEGVSVHGLIVDEGLDGDVFISTGLVDMYSKMGSVVRAREVFDKMPQRDVVAWNAMIDGFSQSADPREAVCLFQEMQLSGIEPNSVTLLNLFPAVCKLLDVGSCKCIHGWVIRRGLKFEVLNGLIDMYSKCGLPEVARIIFDRMEGQDDVSWGTMMSGYIHSGLYEEVLELFDKMKRENIMMNKVSAVSSSLAASELGNLEKGKEIHNCAIKQHIDSDFLVATAVMTMYAKCGDLEKAEEMFKGLAKRDVVAWCAIIASFVQSGSPIGALSLFRKMLHEKLKPNGVTLMSILPACAEVSDMKLGRSIHCYALKAGIDTEVSTGSALVSMYAKRGFFALAAAVFHRMKHKDIVAWNALINGYAQLGYPYHVMETFYNMRLSGTKPDAGTMVGLLPACALCQDLKQGACVHGLVVKSGFEEDIHVRNSLIDTYAKCRMLSVVEFLFNETDLYKDIVCWNTMIAGYALNGCPEKAISTFHQMKEGEVQPNVVSILSVLPAVADLTDLKQGMAFHAYIVQRGFQSNTLVGNSLIDMYYKCGRFDYSENFFDEMKNKDTVSWNAMLAGYAVHGRGLDAVHLFSKMQEHEVTVDSVSFLSVLSACRHAGLVEEGRKLFHIMQDKYCFEPKLEHYSCMVDMFGRSGQFDEIMKLIGEMPMDPDSAVWGSILGACRMHSNTELGEVALHNLAKLEPSNPAHYVNLSDIYAQSGRWTDARDTRLKMTDKGLKKVPGCSWF